MFTAFGVLLGLWTLILIVEGEARFSLIILAIASFIDTVDGTLARRADVNKHAPEIDGALLDNIVDYLVWVFLPVVWAYYFLDLPFLAGSAVLISSLFGFSHKGAKTETYFFRGFPSFWNLVVLYLYVLGAEPLFTTVVMLVLAALVHAPMKFVYPSRTVQWRKLTLYLSLPYSVMLIVMLVYMDKTPLWFTIASFYYPIYYLIVSWLLAKR